MAAYDIGLGPGDGGGMTEQETEAVRGRAVGPLRPTGKIRVDGETFEARSEGAYIEAGAEVVVVGKTSFGLVVRPELETNEKLTADSLPTARPEDDVPEMTPLNAPAALIEQVNTIVLGAIAAGVLVAVGLSTGRPLSLPILSTSVAGLAAGFVFKLCVRGSSDFVGPRVDHRPLAYVVAIMAIIGGAMGIIFGLDSGFGFLGLSAGLVLGTLLGGMIAWGGIILMA